MRGLPIVNVFWALSSQSYFSQRCQVCHPMRFHLPEHLYIGENKRFELIRLNVRNKTIGATTGFRDDSGMEMALNFCCAFQGIPDGMCLFPSRKASVKTIQVEEGGDISI